LNWTQIKNEFDWPQFLRQSQMSHKKLEELQTISKEIDLINKFILQNTNNNDQIFMEYILQKRPNSKLIFQMVTERIQSKKFNLRNKEEHYLRKLIQFMKKNFENDKESLKLFQLFLNSNPEKKKLVFYLTDELSKFESFDLNFLVDLLLGLKTGIRGNWPEFYEFCLPKLMEKFEKRWYRDYFIFDVLEKLINDEEIEKTEKFQLVHYSVEEFLDFSRLQTLEFMSTFSNELTESQLMENVNMFSIHISNKSMRSKFYDCYVMFFKTILVKYPKKSEEISKRFVNLFEFLTLDWSPFALNFSNSKSKTNMNQRIIFEIRSNCFF
jgi:hypothetical protein